MAKKILIVDDEPDILKIVSYRLQKSGYSVLKAQDGKTALAITKKEKPNLILLDVRLPDMDGYEICRKVKADKETHGIPVVFLTASSGGDVSDKANGLKAEGCLVKPFEPEELLRIVKNIAG